MAFLKQNNKKAEQEKKKFDLIPEGDYEIFAIEGKWEDKPDSTPRANFTFVVRSDVDQEFKGRKVFHSFYISRDPEKVETSLGFIERFNLEIGVPDGVEFETQQQWINFVLGKPVKGHIYIDEYNGKENNKIKYFNESEFKEMKEQSAQTESQAHMNGVTHNNVDPFAGGGIINISDDDLPF